MKKKVLTGLAIGIGVVCILATIIFTLFDFKPRTGTPDNNTLSCVWHYAGPEGEQRAVLERQGSRVIRFTLEQTVDGRTEKKENYVPVGAEDKLKTLWERYELSTWKDLPAAGSAEGPVREISLTLGERELSWDSSLALPENGEAFLEALRALLSDYAKTELWG